MTDPMDDIFKRKLENYEMPAPMHLWEGIESAHPPKSDDRQGTNDRWPLLALLLMFLVMAGHTLFLQKNEPFETLDSFPIPAQIHDMQPGVATKTTKRFENEETIQKQKTSIDEPVVAKIRSKNAEKLPIKTSSKTVIDYNSPKTAVVPNLSSDLLPSVDQKTESIPQKILTENKSPRPNDPEVFIDEENSFSLIDPFLSLPMMPSSSLGKQRTIPVLPIDPLHTKNKRPLLSLEVMTGMHYSFRELALEDQEASEYLLQRELTEQVKLGYAGAVRTELAFKKGWSMSGGIRYTQIQERFSFENDQEQRLDEITNIYNSDDVLLRRDTSYILGLRQKVTHNRLHLVDLSIQGGFTKTFGRLSVGLHTGPSFNLLFRKKGDFLAPSDLQPVTFTDNQEDRLEVFKSTLGINWITRLQVSRPINSRISVFVEPYFQYYFQPFSKADFPVQQSYYNGGVGIGVKRIF